MLLLTKNIYFVRPGLRCRRECQRAGHPSQHRPRSVAGPSPSQPPGHVSRRRRGCCSPRGGTESPSSGTRCRHFIVIVVGGEQFNQRPTLDEYRQTIDGWRNALVDRRRVPVVVDVVSWSDAINGQAASLFLVIISGDPDSEQL